MESAILQIINSHDKSPRLRLRTDESAESAAIRASDYDPAT